MRLQRLPNLFATEQLERALRVKNWAKEHPKIPENLKLLYDAARSLREPRLSWRPGKPTTGKAMGGHSLNEILGVLGKTSWMRKRYKKRKQEYLIRAR